MIHSRATARWGSSIKDHAPRQFFAIGSRGAPRIRFELGPGASHEVKLGVPSLEYEPDSVESAAKPWGLVATRAVPWAKLAPSSRWEASLSQPTGKAARRFFGAPLILSRLALGDRTGSTPADDQIVIIEPVFS